MTKEGLEYISNFIRNMTCDENIVRVLKQNYAIKASKEDFNKFSKPDNMTYFYCEYTGSRMIRAYEPFMDVIRTIVLKNNIDVSKMFEDINVYSMNRSIFENYINKNLALRNETPILAEKDFDSEKFIKDIVGILIYLSENNPTLIVINEANQMCDSTLRVLSELTDMTGFNLKILVIFNEMGSVKGYVSEMYSEYLNNCEMRGIVSDWPFEGFSEEPKEEPTFVFKGSTKELDEVCNMYFTYAYEQANYYLNIIYQKVELDKVYVSDEYRRNMLILYIMVSLCRENYAYALILCERIKRMENYKDNIYNAYIYYYFKATSTMYLSNEDDARKYSQLCHNAACKMSKEYEIFMSMLLMNMSELAGWKDIWICDKNIEVSSILIDLCYKYDYLNHLAHIFVYCFDNEAELYYKEEGVEERTPNVTKGICIAERLGNDKFLVEAYRKNIMMASYNGYFNVAGHFYKKSIEIAKRNKNRFEEANIYNGLGYISSTSDKYSEANRYYNKALKIFCECQSSDYILETLYNLGTNAILAGDYKQATEYLMAAINILAMLKKNSLRVCNISKLFGLIAVAYFKQGNLYTAQMYTNKSKNFLRYLLKYCDADSYSTLWDDDMFLFFYVSALLDWKNNKFSKAMDNFNKAEIYMRRSTGSKFINYMLFASDKSEFLKEADMPVEADALLKEAKKYFEEKGNFLRVKMFDDLLTIGQWNYTYTQMPLTEVSFNDIMSFIKNERIENDAKERRNHIRFFGTFQELISNSYANAESQIDTLVTNFKNNFNLDNMIIIMCEDEVTEIRYSDLEYNLSEKEINTILDYFRENYVGFALSKFDNNYYDYDKIVSIFDRSKVFSIVGIPIFKNEKLYSVLITFVKIPESWNAVIYREVLDNEEMEVYTIVFRQILDAIEKFKLNEQLVRQVVTDELTGLYNRKGYYEIIDGMIKSAEQYDRGINCTFMYMDLDHFKYYNDTFGHHVGDAILKKFAEIFKKSCENNGFVVRFGGDEFVMLLNTTDKDRIKSIVSDIYDSIDKEEGFVSLVKEYIEGEVNIPENFRATCSIGVDIGENMLNSSDMSELKKHADAALYYVKYNGRGKMMMYEDMQCL